MKKLIIALALFTSMIQAQNRLVYYQQSLEHFSNPERGLYYAISTKPDGFMGAYRPLSDIDAQGDLQDALDHKFSLIQFTIRLDQFVGTDVIPATFLSDINLDFAQLRAKGLKCILRFSYSNFSTLTTLQIYEPTIDRLLGVPRNAPTGLMPGHINQLRAITSANQDVISSMEAGFIGNYGEWYDSKTTTPNISDFGLGDPAALDAQVPTTYRNNRTDVATAIMTMTPNRMVAFRTPYFQKLLAPNLASLKIYPRYNNSVYARIAAHDDALFHDLYDEGTYRNQISDMGAGDRNYLATKSKTTFTGGETNNNNTAFNSCISTANSLSMTSLDQLAAYHYNYIDYSYFEDVMDPDTGEWASTTLTGGSTCLDEIKRKLGYRYRLLDSSVTTAHTIVIHMVNEGFANIFNPRNVNLVLRNGTATYRFNMQGPVDTNNVLAPGYSTNIRAWYAGTNITLSRSLSGMIPIGGTTVIPDGTYDMYLELPDETITTKKDLYSIRFANADTYTRTTTGPTFTDTFWDATNGFNNLFQTVTVTSGIGSKMASDDMLAFDVISSPNPFANNFKLNITTSSEESVTIKVFDMLGKLIENKTVNASELENLEIGSKLSSGVYNILVKQGENGKTVRVIKK